MSKKILIAVPMYNCENQIVRLLEELFAQKELFQKYQCKLLLIDNNSTDQTLEKAQKSLTKKTDLPYALIKNQHNMGLGGTQKLAFKLAMAGGYTQLVILHGDHQASPSEILPLVQSHFSGQNFCATLGARFMSKSKRVGYSKVRTLGNYSLNWVYSLTTGKTVFDLGSGLNIFEVSCFSIERIMTYNNGFIFNMDLLLDLILSKKNHQYFPITWTEFDQVSNAKNFKVGFKALISLFSWLIGRGGSAANLIDFQYNLISEG